MGWLLLKTIALLALQCDAISIDRPVSSGMNSTMNRLQSQRTKVPGRNKAHFVRNPQNDILDIEAFNDKIMNR
jgi:hypothetical protein